LAVRKEGELMSTATRREKRASVHPARRTSKPRRTAEVHDRTAPTLRGDFGLTRKTLARMTGLSERTLASWETGAKLGEAAQRHITAIERLLHALAAVVHKEAIADWLDKPNDAFGDLKPVEVLERGEADRLWRMIYFLGSGTAS
jgi:DNA-binding transcriptional regulator YiaG